MSKYILNKNNIDPLGETVYTVTLPCGLNTIIIPKNGFQRKFASFAVKYGSDDICFSKTGDIANTVLPFGTAHFLEHKLFEQKKKNAMEAFASLGASANAGTGHTHTKYYFSCVDNFYESLSLLLNFVTNPYITEENVEKEKGIIAQEIKMYDDNPEMKCYVNMVSAMYKSNYARYDIAGTVNDIAKIDSDILLKAYNAFYTPENSVLVISGDVNPDEVASFLSEKGRITFKKSGLPERKFPNEENIPYRKYAEATMSAAKTLFSIGYKDNEKKYEGSKIATKIATADIAVDMLSGTASDFYNRLYESGMVNKEFGAFSGICRTHALTSFFGESDNPEKVLEEIQKEVSFRKEKGFSKREFDMARNAYIGNIVKMTNNPAEINNLFSELYLMGADLFDYFNCCAKITKDDAEEILRSAFGTEPVLSVVKPL